MRLPHAPQRVLPEDACDSQRSPHASHSTTIIMENQASPKEIAGNSEPGSLAVRISVKFARRWFLTCPQREPS
jgi:hypothetical protein